MAYPAVYRTVNANNEVRRVSLSTGYYASLVSVAFLAVNCSAYYPRIIFIALGNTANMIYFLTVAFVYLTSFSCGSAGCIPRCTVLNLLRLAMVIFVLGFVITGLFTWHYLNHPTASAPQSIQQGPNESMRNMAHPQLQYHCSPLLYTVPCPTPSQPQFGHCTIRVPTGRTPTHVCLHFRQTHGPAICGSSCCGKLSKSPIMNPVVPLCRCLNRPIFN
jgi:hypothetical protein